MAFGQSSAQHMEGSANQTINNTILFLFKGMTFDVNPVTLPLALFVMVQNLFIVRHFLADHQKLTSWLYIGIALMDILKAQGQLILSIMGIYVFRNYKLEDINDVSERFELLIYSLYYYMATAVPGMNCSKILNLTLALSLTINIVDPFRTLNKRIIKTVAVIICIITVLLHMFDIIATCLYVRKWGYLMHGDKRFYLYLSLIFEDPGLSGIIASSCFSRSCLWGHKLKYHLLILISAVLYFTLPPTIMLILMVVQVIFLRRNLCEFSSQERSRSTYQHVSLTIRLISLLFFMCNTTYCLAFLLYSRFDKMKEFNINTFNELHYEKQGISLGIAEFTLPLIYAGVYPVILVCRKEDLRHRYFGYWKKLLEVIYPK